MTKQQYEELERLQLEVVATLSLLAEKLDQARCTVCGNRARAAQTTASNCLPPEPNWNAPASDDCHSYS